MEDKISVSLDQLLERQKLEDALGQLTGEQRDKDVTLLTSDIVPFVVSAIKKSIPTKPVNGDDDFYTCPSCRRFIYTPRNEHACSFCGQRLDWFDINE